jgi:hypothetical protein
LQRTAAGASLPPAAAEAHSFGRAVRWRRAFFALWLATVALSVLARPRAAFAVEGPAPEGCHWQRIPEVKATLAVPDGWHFQKLAGEKNVLVFEVRPGGPGAPPNSKSRYELRIQRGLPPKSVVMMAKTFVEGLLSGAVEATPLEEQKNGVMSMFAGVAHVRPNLLGLSQLTIAASSLANARTGTMYTIRIDIPAEELETVMPQANAIFRTITVDDDI